MSIDGSQRYLTERQLEGIWWFLSDPEEGTARTKAAEDGTLERALRTVEWILAEQYRQAMDPPITTWDDGNIRFVEVMRAYRLIVDTENRRCNTRVMEPFRYPVITGGDAIGSVHWDRMFATGAWKRRVWWTVVRNAWMDFLCFKKSIDHLDLLSWPTLVEWCSPPTQQPA